MIYINLEQFKTFDEKIFVGRDRGIEIRKKLQLDVLEEKNDIIIVLLPMDIWTINPSFFRGLFEQSVEKYKEKFWDKYKFLYFDNSELKKSVRDSIEYDFAYILTFLE